MDINSEFFPWMQWMTNREGWGESSHEQELAQYWVYTSLKDFTTIKGADHAWCAMIGCTALEENGYKSNRTASAHSMMGTGNKCELKRGCGVVIRHSSGSLTGHYHFTFCDSINLIKGTFEGRGGNQGDKIGVNTFPIHDVVECFMPELRPTNPDEVEGNPV